MKAILLLALVCAVVFAACSSRSNPNAKSVKISRSQYPDTWCLNVDEGELHTPDGMQVFFTTNNRTYAVNGTAKSHSKHAHSETIQIGQFNCLIDYMHDAKLLSMDRK